MSWPPRDKNELIERVADLTRVIGVIGGSIEIRKAHEQHRPTNPSSISVIMMTPLPEKQLSWWWLRSSIFRNPHERIASLIFHISRKLGMVLNISMTRSTLKSPPVREQARRGYSFPSHKERRNWEKRGRSNTNDGVCTFSAWRP